MQIGLATDLGKIRNEMALKAADCETLVESVGEREKVLASLRADPDATGKENWSQNLDWCRIMMPSPSLV